MVQERRREGAVGLLIETREKASGRGDEEMRGRRDGVEAKMRLGDSVMIAETLGCP